MAEHIEYPCKYSGCSFTAKPDKIKEHEATCFLSIYDCPFKYRTQCKWSGFHSAILDHVHDQHPEDTVELPVIVFICESLDNLNYTEYNILPACGPKENAKNYFYELDFKDNSGTDKRLFVKRLCCPLTDFDEMFDDDEDVVSLKHSLLQPLIDNGDLIYSCNIVPVS
ncbi:E3 ubiquitin-protein ligase SIAH1B-like [Agrilus planipennis]|uniref:E3 ubiquitin-protein ligase SIAH1B-like n=1 Tax=Agrilus planipennis TaxID=224129 RepID=A0A7F5RH31_AGRPL|nr:E3 ubiquitin-protein ligase SIAH1B-like [Agrilus planipennis]